MGVNPPVKVFVSSLIAGFEPFRAAARTAVMTLRHEPIMAEDFGAAPDSPQVACLRALRESDLVVLLLGERYGAVQANSGLSATHEEYREARGSKPVIAFVQEGTASEANQSAFIAEVQAWAGGLFRGGFRDATQLQAGVTRALHDYEMAKAVAPFDRDVLVARAHGLLSDVGRRHGYGESAAMLAIVGGPVQRILRPVELERPELSEVLHREGLFGQARIFDPAKGIDGGIKNSALSLEQERGSAVRLDEEGSILLRLRLNGSDRSGTNRIAGLPVLIEEDVQEAIRTGLTYAGGILDHIDPTQRLAHIAIAAKIESADHLAWRTRAEHDANPHTVSMDMSRGQERPNILATQGRAALRLNVPQITEDILVPLRRQWRSR